MMFFLYNRKSELIIWSIFFFGLQAFLLKLRQVMNKNILFKYTQYLMKLHNMPIAKANPIWDKMKHFSHLVLIHESL